MILFSLFYIDRESEIEKFQGIFSSINNIKLWLEKLYSKNQFDYREINPDACEDFLLRIDIIQNTDYYLYESYSIKELLIDPGL